VPGPNDVCGPDAATGSCAGWAAGCCCAAAELHVGAVGVFGALVPLLATLQAPNSPTASSTSAPFFDRQNGVFGAGICTGGEMAWYGCWGICCHWRGSG
jgi:hypothetical protein